MKQLNKQRGWFQLDMALYLILAAVIATVSWDAWQDKIEEDLRVTIAGELTTVSKAVISYANKYKAEIKANTAVTGVTSVQAPTVAELATLNLGLPSTFAPNPLLNGGYIIKVTPLGGTLDDVRTLVYTANPITNSDNVADSMWATLIAYKIGSKGVYSNTYPDYLYATGGNTFYTNPVVDGTGNGIKAIVGITETLSDNNMLTHWKEPVDNFASLPPCDANSAWHTRIVKTPTVGTGPRAYTCNPTTNTWNALAVDNSGNLKVEGTTSTGKLFPIDVVNDGDTCDAATEFGKITKNAAGEILSCQGGSYQPIAKSMSNESTNYELRYKLNESNNVLWCGTGNGCADRTNLINADSITSNELTHMHDAFMINRSYNNQGTYDYATSKQLVWRSGPTAAAGTPGVQDKVRWGDRTYNTGFIASGLAEYDGAQVRVPATPPSIDAAGNYQGDACTAVAAVADRHFIAMQKIPAGSGSSVNVTLAANGRAVKDGAGAEQLAFNALQVTIDGHVCTASSDAAGSLGWQAPETISCSARIDPTVDHYIALCVEQPKAMTQAADTTPLNHTRREKEYFYITGNVSVMK